MTQRKKPTRAFGVVVKAVNEEFDNSMTGMDLLSPMEFSGTKKVTRRKCGIAVLNVTNFSTIFFFFMDKTNTCLRCRKLTIRQYAIYYATSISRNTNLNRVPRQFSTLPSTATPFAVAPNLLLFSAIFSLSWYLEKQLLTGNKKESCGKVVKPNWYLPNIPRIRCCQWRYEIVFH